MSMYFEAVVLATGQSALIRLLAGLPDLEEPDPFAAITLKVFRVARGRYVVFGWRAGAKRPMCAQEMADLADELTLELGTAVAVHYDDQVGLHAAMVSRDGEPIRYFGEPDEVWVPYRNGELCTDGPRYAGNAVPDDIECDCIWNGIDAALEAAGFRKWITARELTRVAFRAFREKPLWERPGVPEKRRIRLRPKQSRGGR
jgi:hypothetical protein